MAPAVATDVASALTDGNPTTAVTVAATPSTAVSTVSTLSATIGSNALSSKVSPYDQVKVFVDTSGNYCVSAKNTQGGKAWGLTNTGGLTSGTTGCTNVSTIS